MSNPAGERPAARKRLEALLSRIPAGNGLQRLASLNSLPKPAGALLSRIPAGNGLQRLASLNPPHSLMVGRLIAAAFNCDS